MKYLDIEYRKKISKIGLGCGRIGTTIPEELSFELMDYFYKSGGTVLDTARSYSPWERGGYGCSEQCIGKWLEKKDVLNNIVLCTKGGIREDGKIDISLKNLHEELLRSKEALRTDYIDIYLVHKDDETYPIEKLVDNLQFLKEKENLGLVGFSNMKYERFYDAYNYANVNGYDVGKIIQCWWSLAEYTDSMWDDVTSKYMTEELYSFLKEKQLYAMGYTSQCKGYFQKYVKYGREIIDGFLKYRIETDRNIKKAEYIKRYCIENEVDVTAVVNGYITCNDLEGIALVNCNTVDQLIDIVNNCDYELDKHVINEIDKL